MKLVFENKPIVIDENDNSEWLLVSMEVYEPVHKDTSFTLDLYEANASDDEAEYRTTTYYPMLESVKEALKANDMHFKDEELRR